MNVVIIEDEPLISQDLESILSELDHSISVLKILSSVKESVAWLEENQLSCDLLLMDIHLTDGLSFEIFNKVESNTPIIFITAYDQYALEAFKVKGIDYLLKPFDRTKIKKSIEKFKSLTERGLYTINSGSLKNLMEMITSKKSTEVRNSYLIYYRDKLTPLAVKDISWFYKSNLGTYACENKNKRHIIDGTLDKIQNEVSSEDFYRVNRQFIVQKSAIEDIDFYFNGRLIVNVLPKPDEKIIVSKAKATNFKNWLVQ